MTSEAGSVPEALKMIAEEKRIRKLNNLARSGTSPIPVRNQKGDILGFMDRFNPRVKNLIREKDKIDS